MRTASIELSLLNPKYQVSPSFFRPKLKNAKSNVLSRFKKLCVVNSSPPFSHSWLLQPNGIFWAKLGNPYFKGAKIKIR